MSECNCCNELKNEIAGYQQVMKHNMQELKENNETIVALNRELETLKQLIKQNNNLEAK